MKILPPSRMRCCLLALSIILLLQSARAATTIVLVGQGGGRTFMPATVFIQPGDTVEWDWIGNFHSVTSGTAGSPDGIFDSDVHNSGFTFSYTFATLGSFPYYCTIHGPMMAGTVNVVAETPTPTPPPIPTPTPTPVPINISGTVSYCSNPVPGPVPNATLNLTGNASGSTLSDGSGHYLLSFLAAGGSYTVTPVKGALTPGSTGINTVDVIAAQRHFLNIGTPLSGCRLTAADVNGVSGVNTVDVIAIQRFFLGLSTGIANAGKYQFNPVNRTYSALVSDQTAQNYDTLIFGDVATPFADRAVGPQNQPAAP